MTNMGEDGVRRGIRESDERVMSFTDDMLLFCFLLRLLQSTKLKMKRSL